MYNNSMNLMIVANSKYLPYTYTLLFSLFKWHKEPPIRVFFLYEDVTDAEIARLNDFISHHEGHTLVPLYVGTSLKAKIPPKNGFPAEICYRIAGINMLPKELDRILYLDVDIIVKGNLKGLYGANIHGKAFAVCEDIFGRINGFHAANMYRMAIPSEYSYFNSGVMLLNLELLRNECGADEMLRRITENYDHYEYVDQDVMNEMYYDKLLYVDWDMYNCPPAWYYLDKSALVNGKVEFADYATLKSYSQYADGDKRLNDDYINATQQIYENAKVIHYLGDTKPWSLTRNDAAVYDVFDAAYDSIRKEMREQNISLGIRRFQY